MKTKLSFQFISLLFACLAFSQTARAVVPPPDGGYPGFNTAEGQNALFSLTTGTYNTAIGALSLRSLTDGSFCTGIGAGALFVNTATGNTAVGGAALLLNTIGSENTAVGTAALLRNVDGVGNTATGFQALLNNSNGNYNTANGQLSLFTNSTGVQNTATGVNALTLNTSGNNNTATGVNALFNNSNGVQNTADGVNALFNNTSGNENTAVGFRALFTNSGFSNGNTAIGSGALLSTTAGGNTGVGSGALFGNTTGTFNTALGYGAGINVTTASGVIAIGTPGGDVDNSCYIGGIYGRPVDPQTVMTVGIDSSGKLGTTFSSRRFKHDIKPMDKASEAILALKPVTFHYKSDIKSTPCFGLIAEEVAQVNPDLVVRDKNDEIVSVRYDQVNAMLLNEFLKEHRKVEKQQGTIGQLKSNAAKQEATISELRKDMGVLTARMKQQAAQIQKVSAQIELSRPDSRTVLNDR